MRLDSPTNSVVEVRPHLKNTGYKEVLTGGMEKKNIVVIAVCLRGSCPNLVYMTPLMTANTTTAARAEEASKQAMGSLGERPASQVGGGTEKKYQL